MMPPQSVEALPEVAAMLRDPAANGPFESKIACPFTVDCLDVDPDPAPGASKLFLV